MNPTVYLAGPITGCSYTGCTDWREQAQVAMKGYPVTMLSPMRGKSELSGELSMDSKAYHRPLTCQRGIMTRDHWDATRCILLLVNLRGAQRVSIGTVMEVAWAWENGIPVIAIMEDSGNIHDHMMIREAIGFWVKTLDEALDIVKSLLNLEP